MSDSDNDRRVQRWVDPAMFAAEAMPEEAKVRPRVHLLWMTPDPLGAAAAMNHMYTGKVIRSLADVSMEDRQKILDDMRKTILKAPLESIKFHFLIEGVTRGFTHQLVRQRTAVYAQESMRFATFDGDTHMPVSLPPSLAGTEGGQIPGAEDSIAEWRRNVWDQAIEHVEQAYLHLVNSGIPAEDARGLLPTNIQTRVHYVTDLRGLLSVVGVRLCTQAQFEWRLVLADMARAIRTYDPYEAVRDQMDADYGGEGTFPTYTQNIVQQGLLRLAQQDRWQYESIADLFRPICYQTGKCQFESSADRACTIRSRVNANAEIGRPSREWETPHDEETLEQWLEGDGKVKRDGENRPVFIGAIRPAEWLADAAAARKGD